MSYDIDSITDLVSGLQQEADTQRERADAAEAERDALAAALDSSREEAEAYRVKGAEVTAERDALAKEVRLLTHKVITCGVAASHPDPNLSRRAKDYGGAWDSPQAEEVRKLRANAEHFREEYVRTYDKAVELAQRAEAAEAREMALRVALAGIEIRAVAGAPPVEAGATLAWIARAAHNALTPGEGGK